MAFAVGGGVEKGPGVWDTQRIKIVEGLFYPLVALIAAVVVGGDEGSDTGHF